MVVTLLNPIPTILIVVSVQHDPPLQVYADYEATTDSNGVQSPILLCAETDEDDETVSFYGPDCTHHFFEWLEE